MDIKTYNCSNLDLYIDRNADLIYSDCIYESFDFKWIATYWRLLKEGGTFIVQTDWHTVFPIACYLDSIEDSYFINHLVWKNEWGNHPKDRFHQCFDDILIYSRGKNTKFYSDRIQVPKATVNTKLNPSGRETKTATAWIDDICLTTTSNERIKKEDGHLIRWQKPIKLFDRLLLPFTDEGDLVIDPFMGSGTVARWCQKNNRDYIGIEIDKEVYDLAINSLSST